MNCLLDLVVGCVRLLWWFWGVLWVAGRLPGGGLRSGVRTAPKQGNFGAVLGHFLAWPKGVRPVGCLARPVVCGSSLGSCFSSHRRPVVLWGRPVGSVSGADHVSRRLGDRSCLRGYWSWLVAQRLLVLWEFSHSLACVTLDF